MYVLVAGVNHKTAPVEIREKFSISGPALQEAYASLSKCSGVEGTVILHTCNRTEIYATTRNIEAGTKDLENFLRGYSGLGYHELKKYLYQPNCYDAISHIFKVSSGLDSMVLGENQILGQVKEAYLEAIETGASDGVLNALFQKAIYVGKRVRTETELDKYPTSISAAAVELARRSLGDLQDKTVMVVGAGEMSELATRYLMHNGVRSVIVSNRSYDKALSLADSLQGRAIRLDDLPGELPQTDIVISCTAAAHYVINTENCDDSLRKRQGRPIILIDIAVPRDIDPALGNIPGVHLYDIDDLQGVVDANYLERQRASRQAEKIIAEELEKFNQWLGTLYVVPVITALKSQAEAIKMQELNKAMNRLGKISAHQQKVLGSMANSIVNQLLHRPVVTLKEMAVSNDGHLYAEVVKKLFDLEIEHEETFIDGTIETRNQR
ncbi:MAG: glutamyl-tRNA reductase [Syntrophomonadaceae bacterium]|jgi:glutamyl-tRNA reductase|nr:glutamyl-tRNA reductase [Bacillota bacterium]NLM88102.1 glutamyl-tRNA reductase [Syntrophomonadaceae bacterium]HAA09265.1 glutamyl-tRNA reductase [Syntrophomonas sp.]HQA49622.1 glutamyl-tRNA reductase [Syntrophomonadaceae bacterium]HQD90856.1 glutamyl-tRNA reductase [Syntrophomonadaceae bacterium]